MRSGEGEVSMGEIRAEGKARGKDGIRWDGWSQDGISDQMQGSAPNHETFEPNYEITGLTTLLANKSHQIPDIILRHQTSKTDHGCPVHTRRYGPVEVAW